MSASNIHGLSWFPNIPDKFVTWGGQEINLYEVRKGETDAKCKLECLPITMGEKAGFIGRDKCTMARCALKAAHPMSNLTLFGL